MCLARVACFAFDSRAPRSSAHLRDLRLQLVEAPQYLLVAHGFSRWLLSEEGDAAPGIEDRPVDVLERCKALLVRRSLQLGKRDQLAPERVLAYVAVFHQHVRTAFDDLIEFFVTVEKADDHVVHEQK